MTDPTAVPATPATPVAKVVGGLTIVKNIAVEVATLQRPVTAAAVATFVLALIPGVGITVEEATAIIVGVGALDATLEHVVSK